MVLRLLLKLPSSHCLPLCTELVFSLGKEIITLMLRNWYVFVSWKATVIRPYGNSTIEGMLTEALGFYVVLILFEIGPFISVFQHNVTVSPCSSSTVKHCGPWCNIIKMLLS